MGGGLARRIGIVTLALIVVGFSVIELASLRNRGRLNALKEDFCNIELPPGSQRRQCVGLIGTIALSAAPGKHCDYLVWMKVNSDVGPTEMVEWFEERAVTGTDGATTFVPEVFESKAGIAPSGASHRYHVQVIDAGHPPGFDLQCRYGP